MYKVSGFDTKMLLTQKNQKREKENVHDAHIIKNKQE